MNETTWKKYGKFAILIVIVIMLILLKEGALHVRDIIALIPIVVLAVQDKSQHNKNSNDE